ncbi:MAG: hypothetical protein QOH08_2567, partial [Chloroflexota bacterium]|nr:hypothetical protein [Chloroflexota bacterium]
ATGTAVVATARGGLAEILDERSGVLVPAGDVDAFAAAVPRAARLARADCRARAGAFPLDAMLDGYERELARA